jgi:methylated-DNA-[protein]-cysteine S-methyltransferase
MSISESEMNYVYKIVPSPIGNLKLVGSDKGLAAILWESDNPRRVRVRPHIEDKEHPVLLETERQLNEYFQGKSDSLSLKLDPLGMKFQNDVWQALLAIPFGETRSYADRQSIGEPAGNTRRGRRQWKKSNRHHCSLPSSDRFFWKGNRIRRRT